MKNLRLEVLRLRNFQGVRDFSFEPNGASASVLGDNGTGKTTLLSAFAWLLFGKDSHGRADFEIKTLDATGEPLHGLEHEVAAALTLGDRRLSLRKVYKEQWTKKRGQAEPTFTGHTTDHFLDGVPVPKGEYDAAVGQVASEDVFRSLTDPSHFADRIHWTERRTALLELCGDVSDQDVIDSDPALADLPGFVEGRSMDDHKKIVAARRKEINEQIESIPHRIDEKTRDLPDVADLDADALKARQSELRTARAAAEDDRARIAAGGEAAEKRKALAEVEAKLQRIATRVTGDTDAQRAKLRADLDELQREVDAAEREATLCDRAVRDAAAEIDRLQALIDEKAAARAEWNAETFDADSTEADACAACGQKLPADQVAAARAKAEQEFNAGKARRLTTIGEEIATLEHQRDAHTDGSEERVRALEAAEEIAEILRGRLKEATDAYGTIEAPAPEADAEYQQVAAKKRALEGEISELATDNAGALAAAAGKVAAVDEQLADVERKLARIEPHERAQERISELKREERRLANEYEELERQLYLIEAFVRRKAAMLTDRINARFDTVGVKLFDIQVNGGVREICEVSVDGVPYNAGLNHGARVNAGLEIIDVLAEHHGLAAPIFVDGAESVTSLRPTTGQQIRLVVSGQDTELHVHINEKAEAPA